MKTSLLILLLLLITVSVFGQSFLPEWSIITDRIWAKNDWSMCDTVQFSCGGIVLIDNHQRLDQALLEIRDTNPEVFDQIFRNYHLAIDTR